MEQFFRTTDFRATVRDFDYTRKAVRGIRAVVTSEDFLDMDSEKIFQYLLAQMRTFSFRNYLKRYIYAKTNAVQPFAEVPDEHYRRVIDSAFARNRAPHSFTPTSVKRGAAIKRWLEQDSVQRATVLALGFGLRMDREDVSEFLTKAIQEADFDGGDPWEMICRFCFENGLPYARAAALMEEYNGFPAGRGAKTEVEPLPEGSSEAKLRKWLKKMRAAGTRERADAARRAEFMGLYRQCQQVVAALYQEDESCTGSGHEWRPEDVRPADIERVLCDGIPRTGSGNLQKMSQSMLNRQFQQRRLTRQRLDSLIKGELAIERFDLITLGFMVASQREDEDPVERLRRYMDDMNAALARCDMMKLYPVNPYEAFTMMCLLAEMPLLTYYDVWEMSYGT